MPKVLVIDDSATMRKIIIKGIDIILTDINMQNLDVITTEDGLEKMQEALDAGANDYLKKPFTPEELKEKLAPFLS